MTVVLAINLAASYASVVMVRRYQINSVVCWTLQWPVYSHVRSHVLRNAKCQSGQNGHRVQRLVVKVYNNEWLTLQECRGYGPGLRRWEVGYITILQNAGLFSGQSQGLWDLMPWEMSGVDFKAWSWIIQHNAKVEVGVNGKVFSILWWSGVMAVVSLNGTRTWVLVASLHKDNLFPMRVQHTMVNFSCDSVIKMA